MKSPINHHYVPQHFLEAWTSDGTRTNRYRRNTHNKKVDFKKGVGIVNLASEDHLYVVEDGVDRAEFETSIVTELLDTPGAVVIKKIRDTGFAALSEGELDVFARYVVMLEARNPRTISQMALSERDMEAIIASQPAIPGLRALLRTVASKLMSLNTGKVSSGLIIANDKAFSKILAGAPRQEVNAKKDELISSSYPVGRVGRYDTDFLITLAVSPRVGVIWCTMPKLHRELSALTPSQQAVFINYMTLGYAEAAYTKAHEPDELIHDNLGWRIDVEPAEDQRRMAAILSAVGSV